MTAAEHATIVLAGVLVGALTSVAVRAVRGRIRLTHRTEQLGDVAFILLPICVIVYSLVARRIVPDDSYAPFPPIAGFVALEIFFARRVRHAKGPVGAFGSRARHGYRVLIPGSEDPRSMHEFFSFHPPKRIEAQAKRILTELLFKIGWPDVDPLQVTADPLGWRSVPGIRYTSGTLAARREYTKMELLLFEDRVQAETFADAVRAGEPVPGSARPLGRVEWITAPLEESGSTNVSGPSEGAAADPNEKGPIRASVDDQ